MDKFLERIARKLLMRLKVKLVKFKVAFIKIKVKFNAKLLVIARRNLQVIDGQPFIIFRIKVLKKPVDLLHFP